MPLTPVEERLFAGLAAQAGLVLRGARLRAELSTAAAELSGAGRGAAGLPRSGWSTPRTPSAAAARARHPRRRAAAPRRARGQPAARADRCRRGRPSGPRRSSRPAGAPRPDADRRRCVELSRGIYPPLLGERRARPGPASRPSATSPVPVDGRGRRPRPATPREVEAAAYFCCLEALQNAAKHAGADARPGDAPSSTTASWRSRSTTTARGFDPRRHAAGAGLANMRDRVDSVGGSLDWARAPGGGTRVQRALLPARTTGGAEVRARVAWVLAGLTLRAGRSPTSRSTAAVPPAVLRDGGGRARVPVHPRGRPRLGLMGALIVSRVRAPPDRLAARRASGPRRRSRCSARSTASGWTRRAVPGRRRSAGVAGWLVGALRRAARVSPGSPLMFLLAPGRALAVAALALRRGGRRRSGCCCASSGCSHADPTLRSTAAATDVGPRRAGRPAQPPASCSIGGALVAVGGRRW